MEHPFLREEMLIGHDALIQLQHSHVAVFGIGGVGSFCAEALARAGIGALTLIDHDTVSLTNLNRQLIALHSTIGQNKAEVMAARILDINPNCQFTALPLRYTEENKAQFFTQHYHYIIDAIDIVTCKLSLIQNAHQRSIPIVSAMGTGNKLHPELFQITDISKTQVCPLARIMRKELRARGIVHHMTLWSPEVPVVPQALEAPPPGRNPTPASVSWVPSCAGLMLAGFVLRSLIASDAE